MKKKLIIGVALLLMLTGCGDMALAETPEDHARWASHYENNAYAITVPLPDGRSVICVVLDDSGTGTNLDCDWPHAK